jgi:hypothetical protein
MSGRTEVNHESKARQSVSQPRLKLYITHMHVHAYTCQVFLLNTVNNLIRGVLKVTQYCNLTSCAGTQYVVITSLYITALNLMTANCIWYIICLSLIQNSFQKF